jgi:hypothetical protein
MTVELRYDRGTIEIAERGTDFLRARVVIARPGVFPYLTPSGKIHYEAKLPEDLFSEITINSAKGRPITDGHPPVQDNDGMVDTANWKEYTKGSLGDTITIANGMLEATETIFDAGLIKDLEAGKKLEVSIGFATQMDYTPGEFEGEKYDAKQTSIKINHVAHVEEGRAGEDVRVYLDSVDGKYAVQINDEELKKKENKNKPRRDSKMTFEEFFEKLKSLFGLKSDSEDDDKDKGKSEDEKEKDEIDDDSDDEKDKSDSDSDEDEEKKNDSKEVKKLKKRLREEKAKRDTAEAVLKKLKGDQNKQDMADMFNRAVNDRISLLETAKAVVPDVKHDMSDRDIMLKVIEKHLPFDAGTKVSKLDSVHIKARFDAAMELAKVKANFDVAGPGSANRIDTAAVNAKKASRLSVMEDIKK